MNEADKKTEEVLKKYAANFDFKREMDFTKFTTPIFMPGPLIPNDSSQFFGIDRTMNQSLWDRFKNWWKE